MEIKLNSDFAKNLLKVLQVTGLGNLVSASMEAGQELLVIDVGPMEIPQYPVNQVYRIERITVEVANNAMPVVYCRNDFPVVPHLNLLQDGKKTLCLFDVSFKELEYTFNASVFVHRIIRWFELTARGELHQPDQPLEPYFPNSNQSIILNLDNSIPFVRLEEIETPTNRIYQEIPLDCTNRGNIYTVLVANIEKVYSQNIINSFPQNLGDLDTAFNESITDIIKEAIPTIWSIKQAPKYYDLLFQQKESSLKNSNVLVVVRIGLSRSKDTQPEQHHFKVFQIAKSFQDIYQAFGYKRDNKRKLVQQEDSQNYKNIPVYPFEVLGAFNKSFAASLSSHINIGIDEQFVQIGVGALGSQIANNCIRSGYGKWTYIDPDIILPHNLSRHCLEKRHIGTNKATSLKAFADSLYSWKNDVVQAAITANVFDENAHKDISTAIEDACLLVDCSASVAVERYLVNNLLGNTRAVSFFMNPSGTALIMLLEDSARKITLDTLEMQYYRMLTQKSDLKEHLKTNDRVLYSTTCRGSSLVYPQEHAAIFAGICTKALKSARSSSDASVCVWTLNNLSIEQHKEDGDAFQEIQCDGWRILVSSTLAKQLHTTRAAKLPNETGGVLIGSYDFANNICYVVDAIDSPPDSEEYPFAYIRGSNGLSEKVSNIEDITIGNLTYIGEWHSHPNDLTNPSPDDRILLESVASYTLSKSSPGCMMIVGDSHISVYLQFL